MRGKDNELLGPGLKAQLAALQKALPETALASKQELEVPGGGVRTAQGSELVDEARILLHVGRVAAPAPSLPCRAV